MKIEVITYHNSYNYGSYLQAYATIRFFESLGCSAELIDYCPKNFKNYGSFMTTFREKSNEKKTFLLRLAATLVKIPSYRKQKTVFREFVKRYMPLSRAYGSCSEIAGNLPEADVFCTGSDQVWNNYFTHCFDSAYFLDFLPEGTKCFSFASSFGREHFDAKEIRDLSERLKKYDLLTVREDSGIITAHMAGRKDAKKLLDPTLMVPEKEWNYLADQGKSVKGKYILVYQLHGDSRAINEAMRFGKEQNLPVVRIITMFHQKRHNCKNIILPDIPTFLRLFRDAQVVFTDSFHGTAFSLIFRKKMGITLPEKFSDRIRTITEETGTEKMIIRNYDKWKYFSSHTDSEAAGAILQNIREKDIAIIKKYLVSCETQDKGGTAL